MQLPEEESGASRRRLCFIKAGCAERCFEENPFLPRLGSESGKKRETNQEKPQPFFDSKCCFCLELEAFREWEIQNCFSLSPSSLDPSYFSKCIAHTLYEKYSSSQNYYNAKEIGEYLSSARTSGAIKIRDFLDFDNSNEFLKRFYSSGEYQGKIRMLSEYYKFHRDIPRLFMLPPTTILNRFHDEKRRSEFKKITKLLSSDDEKEKNSEKYLRERNTDPNEFNQAARHRTLPQKPKSSKYYLDGNDTLNREAKGTSGVNEGRNPGRKRGTEESCSRTIKELNSKLGEIISRVCQVPKLEMEPTLENEEKDLASFITFLKKKEQGLREGEQNQESERKKLESEDDSEILPRKRERNEMEEEANGNFNGEDCPTKEETKGLESPSKEPMSNDEKASINSQKRENQKNKSSKTTTATESVYSLASKRNFFKIYSNESSSQKGSGILPVSLYNGNASGKEAQGPMHHMLSQQNFPNKFVGKETKPEVIKEDAADEQNENCQEDINIFRRKISLDEKFLFQPVHASKIQWGEERQNRGKVPTDQKGVEPNEKKEAQEPSGKRRGVLSSSPSKEQIKNSSSLVKTECCHNKKKPKGKETQTRNYCANEKNQSRDKKERETKKNSICFLPDKKENKNKILDHQNQKLAGTNFTSKGELASHQLNLHPETKLNQKGPQKSKENDLDAAMLSKLQETRKAKEPKCFNKHGIVQESMSISRSESTCQIQKQPRPKAKIMNEMESQASKKTQKKTTTQQEASKGTNKMTKSLACFSMMRPSFVNVQPSPKNKPSLVPQTHTYIGAETSKKCIEPTSGLMKNGTIPNYISNHLKSSSHAKFRESLKNQQRNKEATKKPTGTSKSPGSQSKEQKPKTKGENHQLQNHSLKPNNGASSPKLQTLKEKLKTKKPLKELRRSNEDKLKSSDANKLPFFPGNQSMKEIYSLSLNPSILIPSSEIPKHSSPLQVLGISSILQTSKDSSKISKELIRNALTIDNTKDNQSQTSAQGVKRSTSNGKLFQKELLGSFRQFFMNDSDEPPKPKKPKHELIGAKKQKKSLNEYNLVCYPDMIKISDISPKTSQDPKNSTRRSLQQVVYVRDPALTGSFKSQNDRSIERINSARSLKTTGLKPRSAKEKKPGVKKPNIT